MATKEVITLRRPQMQVFRCPRRFRVLVAGRRFGKTQLALVELLRAACGPGRQAWYVAPSERQAKQIAWDRLKELTRTLQSGRPNESDLSVRLLSGGVIALRGADRYESLRGHGLDFVALDEYGSMRPECWTEVLRPALSDRQGRALFIGTPQGANHFWERFEYAQKDPEWSAFRFTTAEGGNVSAEELESAARELDQRLYRQEFEASFENTAIGLAYDAFSRDGNVGPCAFRPSEPLIWSLDFNVHPMCSVLAQRFGERVQVLDEMVLDNANTSMACEAFLKRVLPYHERTTTAWGHKRLLVEVYGDASGHQRRTAAAGTDWSLLREFFGRVPAISVRIRAATSNPSVRDRVNVMNSRLCSALGERALTIDPRCRELIRDLELVRWSVDRLDQPTNELDKSDRKRTHISDALGYYVAEAFAMRRPGGHCGSGRLV